MILHISIGSFKVRLKRTRDVLRRAEKLREDVEGVGGEVVAVDETMP